MAEPRPARTHTPGHRLLDHAQSPGHTRLHRPSGKRAAETSARSRPCRRSGSMIHRRPERCSSRRNAQARGSSHSGNSVLRTRSEVFAGCPPLPWARFRRRRPRSAETDRPPAVPTPRSGPLSGAGGLRPGAELTQHGASLGVVLLLAPRDRRPDRAAASRSPSAMKRAYTPSVVAALA